MRKRTVRRAAGALALAACWRAVPLRASPRRRQQRLPWSTRVSPKRKRPPFPSSRTQPRRGGRSMRLIFPPRTPSIITTWPGTMGRSSTITTIRPAPLFRGSPGDDGQESGTTAQEATPAPSQSSQSGAGITEDEARSIALEHAGVTAEEATVYRVKADYERRPGGLRCRVCGGGPRNTTMRFPRRDGGNPLL